MMTPGQAVYEKVREHPFFIEKGEASLKPWKEMEEKGQAFWEEIAGAALTRTKPPTPGQAAYEQARSSAEAGPWFLTDWEDLPPGQKQRWEIVAAEALRAAHQDAILDCGAGILVDKGSIQALEPGLLLTESRQTINGCVLTLHGGAKIPVQRSPEEVRQLLGW